MQDGAGLTLLAERINQTIDKAMESGSTAGYAKDLHRAVQRLVEVTATLWAAGDVATTLANSTVYLEAAGHAPFGKVLLIVAALGIAAFGAYSFVRARYGRM